MKPKNKTQFMTLTALLTALAIVIPLMMPLKLVIPPASYTLASHVPIFIAMFISPLMALIVILGSTFGFFISSYPLVIVLRAFSHLAFGIAGALYLKKFPDTLEKTTATWIFNITLALIHATAEVLACIVFYLSTEFPSNLFISLFVLVGFGTIIHSIVDFVIAKFIYQQLKKIR